MFNPAYCGYPLKPDFDRRTLDRLLNHFEGEVKRDSTADQPASVRENY